MNVDYRGKPILEIQDIVREFSGAYALSGTTFDLYRPEIHCLVGRNGAGKPTLMKVLSGAYTSSGEKACIDGKDYRTLTPILSRELGVNIVYQENDLVPNMNVVGNTYAGNEVADRSGLVSFKATLEETRCQMEDLKVHIDPLTKTEGLSVFDQQFVKMLKTLPIESKAPIMDGPTFMFNVEDAAKALQLAQIIAAEGIGIIYTSHYLEEIRQIVGRTTVIHDGAVVNTYENTNRDIELPITIRDVVGRPVDTFYQKERHEIGEVMLEVRDLQLEEEGPKVSSAVRKGKIFRFVGMMGVGRIEIVRTLTGVDSKYGGDVLINGKKVVIHNPRENIKHGFTHITEDRQGLGLMLHISVLGNATIVGLGRQIRGFLMGIKKYPHLIKPLVQKPRIKTPSVRIGAVYLSDGNQQKVVSAKWLSAQQKIYIFDEPTRGIDVDAKAKFYKQMSELIKQGKCIIMISSDMPELIPMSDRVFVIRDGAVDSELTGEQTTEQEIIRRVLGVKEDGQ